MSRSREATGEWSSVATVRTSDGGGAAGGAGTSALCLHVVRGATVATHPLPQAGTVVIGRARDADVTIPDVSLSRRHAAIHVGAKLRVEDLGSKNGVKVADKRLPPGGSAEVGPGTVIECGDVMLVVQHGATAKRARRIWSHGYFEGRVEEECARAQRRGGAFVVTRLRVQRISDERAHEILAASVRASDVLAVYGPGEYELLLEDATPETAAGVVSHLVEALARSGAEVRTGSAAYPSDGRAPDALVAAACERVRGASGRGTAPRGTPGPIGESMQEIERVLARIAQGTLPVLVLGETGVGKELVAAMVHRLSPRANQPFVTVNCAALSETLVASEIFGHEKGAFTGADRTKPGLLETAQGGTVFLDEVGELPLDVQAKLLRVLEERLVTRVGGTRAMPLDVRFVAATNRALDDEVEAGRFRRDLLYRLNGFTVVIPPLRERPGEILPIAQHLLAIAAAENGRPPPALDAAAARALTTYSWPGNVREVRNVVERAVLLAAGDAITPEHLPLDKMTARVTSVAAPPSSRAPSRPSAPPPPPPPAAADVDPDRQRVVDVLAQCGGNQTHAARMLGIARGTLIARMDAYGLTRPRKRRP